MNREELLNLFCSYKTKPQTRGNGMHNMIGMHQSSAMVLSLLFIRKGTISTYFKSMHIFDHDITWYFRFIRLLCVYGSLWLLWHLSILQGPLRSWINCGCCQHTMFNLADEHFTNRAKNRIRPIDPPLQHVTASPALPSTSSDSIPQRTPSAYRFPEMAVTMVMKMSIDLAV